jgi:hypothetical protein
MDVSKNKAAESSLKKPVLHYWYYVYKFSDVRKNGFGGGFLSTNVNFFPIREATANIRKEIYSQCIAITNFIEISKEAADELAGGDANLPINL